MFTPARTRESFSIAAIAEAPPIEWPAIATRDRSIRPPPSHAEGSRSSTKETSAARPSATTAPKPGSDSLSQARHSAIRPSARGVAWLS
jgi:hypothetical protein